MTFEETMNRAEIIGSQYKVEIRVGGWFCVVDTMAFDSFGDEKVVTRWRDREAAQQECAILNVVRWKR